MTYRTYPIYVKCNNCGYEPERIVASGYWNDINNYYGNLLIRKGVLIPKYLESIMCRYCKCIGSLIETMKN